MEILWIVLLVLFIVVEASTVSMVSVWFAIGAVAALIVNLFGAELWLQVTLFVVASAISLALLRPLAKKHLNPKITQTNVGALVGKTCIVTADIDNLHACGQVKLGDVEWSARSTAEETIPAGTEVRIDRVEGVKVYVTPVAVAVQ